MGSDEDRSANLRARSRRTAAPAYAAWPDPSSRRRDFAPGEPGAEPARTL